jgi:hypothetical protein
VDAPSIAAQIGYMYPISLTLALRGVCAPRGGEWCRLGRRRWWVDVPSIAVEYVSMYSLPITRALEGVCAHRVVAEKEVANGVDSDDGAGG